MKIEYINNDKKLGINYDFNFLKKEYKKLGCPKEYNNPFTNGLEKSNIHLLLSERSTGKTTNLLIMGMLMHEHYGTTMEYIRSNDKMITLQKTKNLFDVILEYDYVSKITNGKYNSVCYKSKRWYFCEKDEDGEIVNVAPTHFMCMLACNESDNYKSSYNAPRGDLIIYDEFISMNSYTPRDEFIWYNDIIKTIIRNRISPHIFMLANTIDREHRYFDELGIYDDIQTLELGESRVIYTEVYNTPIYVKWISQYKSRQSMADNIEQVKRFFGFQNKKLASIIGGSEWATRNYAHIDSATIRKSECIARNFYIRTPNRLINIELYFSEDMGMFALCHDAKRTYDDSIIYTRENISSKNERFFMGASAIDKKLWNLYKNNRFFYSTNGVGLVVDKFVNEK